MYVLLSGSSRTFKVLASGLVYTSAQHVHLTAMDPAAPKPMAAKVGVMSAMARPPIMAMVVLGSLLMNLIAE